MHIKIKNNNSEHLLTNMRRLRTQQPTCIFSFKSLISTEQRLLLQMKRWKFREDHSQAANMRKRRAGAQAQCSLQHGAPKCFLYLYFVLHFHSFYQSLNLHKLNSAFCKSFGVGIPDFCVLHPRFKS